MAIEEITALLELLTKAISENNLKIELLTSSLGPIDYAVAFLPSLVPIIVILLTYSTLKSRMELLIHEKITTKDIDRLYEASDLYFKFYDSASLLFSMNRKKAIRTLSTISDALGFNEKFENSNTNFFDTIHDAHKSAFIFSTIESVDIAKKIDAHREKIIKIRKEQAATIEADNQEGLLQIKENYETLKQDLNKDRDEIFNQIISCKKALKNQAST